ERSVGASSGALGVSTLKAFAALVLLVLALVTAPIRHSAGGLRQRSAVLSAVDVQVHLGDPSCVAELESIVWKTLTRAQQTWAPMPLPLDRVVVGAGFQRPVEPISTTTSSSWPIRPLATQRRVGASS